MNVSVRPEINVSCWRVKFCWVLYQIGLKSILMALKIKLMLLKNQNKHSNFRRYAVEFISVSHEKIEQRV